MVGDVLKKNPAKFKRPNAVQMQKKKKKIPRKKKIIIIRIKKNSGGVKPQWTELPEKGLPLCT